MQLTPEELKSIKKECSLYFKCIPFGSDEDAFDQSFFNMLFPEYLLMYNGSQAIFHPK